MYIPTTLQVPKGHMTRPRTYVIGHKVNSLLSELSLSTCETWLLPPTCVLCMIRYLEESHGATTSNGRATEDAKYKDQEKKLPEIYSHRTTGLDRMSDAWRLHQPAQVPASETYSGRTTDATGRPTSSSAGPVWKSDDGFPKPKRRTSDKYRTTGPSRATGRPVPVGRPAHVFAQSIGPRPMYPPLTPLCP